MFSSSPLACWVTSISTRNSSWAELKGCLLNYISFSTFPLPFTGFCIHWWMSEFLCLWLTNVIVKYHDFGYRSTTFNDNDTVQHLENYYSFFVVLGFELRASCWELLFFHKILYLVLVSETSVSCFLYYIDTSSEFTTFIDATSHQDLSLRRVAQRILSLWVPSYYSIPCLIPFMFIALFDETFDKCLCLNQWLFLNRQPLSSHKSWR
jgi:hypothetical protein